MNFNSKVFLVVLSSFLVHLLLLKAVFDTYFASPLEHGLVRVKSNISPISKRIVLFVADGLRAEAIFDDNEYRTPYLTSVRNYKGSWGIAHTRVPTESRPGHVALLGGIFEDPSAILQGWKHNPVKFDSVINESTRAWCWGSPDIVPIFKTDDQEHIKINCYDSNMQDFGEKNTWVLDKWVFDKVTDFLTSVKSCKSNCDIYYGYGNIYFLHLLGMDTAGHAFKPDSKEYNNNIELLDTHINKIEMMFNKVFPDSLTTFIFASDHGMTDWGSHGSGLDVETQTPFIAWGAGIKKENVQKDLRQIDIASLMSGLLGINYPVNSLGKLPYEYLNISKYRILSMYLTNILQVFNIYDAKRIKTAQTSIFFKPYKDLTPEYFDQVFSNIHDLATSKASIGIDECDKLIVKIFDGINYYQDYHMNTILLFVSVGLIIWIIYLSTFFVPENHNLIYYTKNIFILRLCLIFSAVLVTLLCYMQSHPVMYYCYFIFPIIMLHFMLNEHAKLLYICTAVTQLLFYQVLEILMYALCIVFFISGFYHRIYYSAVMLLTSFWILLSPNLKKNSSNKEKFIWIFFCVFLSVFPMLPTMSRSFQKIPFVIGFVMWIVEMYYLTSKSVTYNSTSKYKHNRYFYYIRLMNENQTLIFKIQKIYSVLAFVLVLLISSGTFSEIKSLSWTLFVLSILTVPCSSSLVTNRLLSILMGLAPYYIMTSTSYELIFITFYTGHLTLWLFVETKIKVSNLDSVKFGDKPFMKIKEPSLENLRKCIIFMTFILMGFFGTGNMASMNSFDPMWVRCFLTVFSPFQMTFLIVLKLLIPFIYTTCLFRGIVLATGVELLNLFCGILFFSDIMVCYFMFNIKNVGSWLDIGMSLSHFVVVEVFVFGIILLYSLAYVLTNFRFFKTYSRT